MNTSRPNYALIGLLLAVFGMVGLLVYQQIFTNSYASDTQKHIVFLYVYFYGEDSFYIPHPLWHCGVFFFSKIFRISVEHAAVVFSALLVVIWTYLVYRIARHFLQERSRLFLTAITLAIIMIGPLCIPWYNKIIFLGQGSPNIWHNVTLWTVKPFALLAVVFVVEALRNGRFTYYFFAFASVILSLFAKPSFAIMFLPALILFALCKKIRDKRFYLFYMVVSVTSAAILLYQFTHTFNSGDSKLVFDFLGVWSRSSPNVAVSILLALAFPLLLTLLEPSLLEDDYIMLSWLQVFIGIFLFALFAQTGKYYYHGNFGWSYMLAMSLLYLFAIVKYFERYGQMHPLKRYVLLLLFLVQVGIGGYYFFRVFQGQNPLYIAIYL